MTVSPNVETSARNLRLNRRYKLSQIIGLNSVLIDSIQQGTHGGTSLVLSELLRFWIFFSFSTVPKIPTMIFFFFFFFFVAFFFILVV